MMTCFFQQILMFWLAYLVIGTLWQCYSKACVYYRHLSDDAFADVYKVEPISGIFIASQVIGKPMGHNIGPQHLASVISFDHGATWRPIKAPLYDEEGQQTACQLENNCSLHLSQKFAHYYPDIRSIGILSSKSAPGLIIATGVIGKHMKVSFS